MAIFRTSSVVGAISGNVGGVCFVNNRKSKVLRQAKKKGAYDGAKLFTKGSSTKAFYPKHQTEFNNAILAWRQLTTDSKNAWTTYANDTPVSNRLGEQSPLSGYQAFIKNRLFNTSGGGTPSDDPPLIAEQPLIAPLSLAWSLADGLRYTVGQGPIAGTIKIQISGMPLYTDSIPKYWSRFRVMSDLSAGQNSSFTITNIWQSNWPLPLENQVLAFRTRFISDNKTFRGESTQIIKVTA